jgi:hypothetical protein
MKLELKLGAIVSKRMIRTWTILLQSVDERIDREWSEIYEEGESRREGNNSVQ